MHKSILNPKTLVRLTTTKQTIWLALLPNCRTITLTTYLIIVLVGADVSVLKKEPGVPFTLSEIGAALEQHKPVMFFVTHGESSTGCLQDLEGIGALCARLVCLKAGGQF